MANTIIQIKRSSSTDTPANGSLTAAELAYSYQSGKLFLGTSDGLGTIAIGGKYFIDRQNTIYSFANSINSGLSNTATSANAYADYVGASANAFASLVGRSGNNWANTVGTAGNNYTNAVGTAGNNYTNYVGAAGNAVTALAAASGNNWANTVGTAGNNYTNYVGSAGNNYTNYVGTAANNYASGTYYQKTGGLISGDVIISGNVNINKSLVISGNTYQIDAEILRVSDPLIYLAGNNYTSDVVDIGFVANYVNTGGVNVHTGLVRSSSTKEYYLFQGYSKEPEGNYIDISGNNFTIAVLNADLITSNLTLGGTNAINWIVSAYAGANAAFSKANDVATSANAYANYVGAAGNAYTNYVGTSGNAYALATTTSIGTAGNNYTNYVGASVNAYVSLTGTAGNNYTDAVGTAGNNYANYVGTAGNNYSVYVGASGNNWANLVASNASLLTTGTVPSARISGSYTGINGVGTITVGTWNGNTVNVAYGGTGITSATLNGVLFGSGGSGAIQVTSAGTEGQVLQASAAGVPNFGMLDGGTF